MMRISVQRRATAQWQCTFAYSNGWTTIWIGIASTPLLTAQICHYLITTILASWRDIMQLQVQLQWKGPASGADMALWTTEKIFWNGWRSSLNDTRSVSPYRGGGCLKSNICICLVKIKLLLLFFKNFLFTLICKTNTLLIKQWTSDVMCVYVSLEKQLT